MINCSNTVIAGSGGGTWNLNGQSLRVAYPSAGNSYNAV